MLQPSLQGRRLTLRRRLRAKDLHPLDPGALDLLDHGGLGPLELIALGDPFLVAPDLDHLGCSLAGQRRLHPGREPGRDLAGQGESGQIEVPGRGDLGPGLQRRHLAVADIEQPGPVQQGADPAIQGEIQRVVGRIAGMDIAGQEQATGKGGGGHELDLGQVGAMVLAVPQLHQAVVIDGVVAVAGGGVEVDPLDRRQGIDVALGAPEVGLQLRPGLRIAETAQDRGEAVVGELDGPKGLVDEGLQGALKAVGPGLDR